MAMPDTCRRHEKAAKALHASLFGILLWAYLLINFAHASRGSNEITRPLTSGPRTNFGNVTEGKRRRLGKVFSIFNVVQFQDVPCRSTSTRGATTTTAYRNGTCFTQAECVAKTGSVQGSCAAGFGVCCVFAVSMSASTITQNCTYIQNPGFPASLAGGTSVSYTISKCDSLVCWLRLDFDTFTLLGTGATTELNGGACLDSLAITTSNTGRTIPPICGQNTGQHIYVDLGSVASDTATLTFSFTATDQTTGRTWEIKVSQITCFQKSQPPDCCLQYYTGLTGRFTTFNFISTNDNHLQSQRYSACIRQECGYCCVRYQLCADANSFSIQNLAIGKRDNAVAG